MSWLMAKPSCQMTLPSWRIGVVDQLDSLGCGKLPGKYQKHSFILWDDGLWVWWYAVLHLDPHHDRSWKEPCQTLQQKKHRPGPQNYLPPPVYNIGMYMTLFDMYVNYIVYYTVLQRCYSPTGLLNVKSSEHEHMRRGLLRIKLWQNCANRWLSWSSFHRVLFDSPGFWSLGFVKQHFVSIHVILFYPGIWFPWELPFIQFIRIKWVTHNYSTPASLTKPS